jgi:hypothetical protein
MTKLLALEMSLVTEIRKLLFMVGHKLHARREK